MPPTHPSRMLYRIDECPDLMADGCVGDEHGNLIFLSVWARDTAVQEFLARLTLGRDAQGLDQFHVRCGERTGRVRLASSSRDARGRPERYVTTLHKEPPLWRQYRMKRWARWWARKQKTRQKARHCWCSGGQGGIRTRVGILSQTRFPGV